MKFTDLFWVSSCYVGGVNLQELIFLIGREEFLHLDHITLITLIRTSEQISCKNCDAP